MVDKLRFELRKLLHSKLRFVLLILNVGIFPSVVFILSRLHEADDIVTKDIFINNIAYSSITFSQTYFFIPVWLIIIIGAELSKGHVNRVVFIRSKKYYFLSKLYYCISLVLFFTLMGLISLIVSIGFSQYQLSDISIVYWIGYLGQIIISNFIFGALLMLLVFLIKSPIKAFMAYFIWSFLEGIIYTFFSGVYQISLKWMPLHLARSTYAINGETQSANYYNPLLVEPVALLLPFLLGLIALFLAYQFFYKADLKTLSD